MLIAATRTLATRAVRIDRTLRRGPLARIRTVVGGEQRTHRSGVYMYASPLTAAAQSVEYYSTSDDDENDENDEGKRGPTRTERRRRARFASVKLGCPACGQEIRSNAFRMHLHKCAPDLLASVPANTWMGDGDVNAGATRARELANEANEFFASEVKRMCYRRRDDESDGERLSAKECAEALGVPTQRVKMTLRRESLAIELVRDETPLDVVFEDDEFLVVNKPPNLRFHPNHRFEGNSLLSRALHHLNGSTPYIVHRLDMDTSGVAVFVKKPHLVADVAAQFQNKTAKKTYLAISVGVAPPGCSDSFIVDAPIGDHGIVREARNVDFTGEGKPARTTCEIVSQTKTTLFDIADESVAAMTTPKGVSSQQPSSAEPAAIAALVRVLPLTGRTHQIRVHLAHAGLPIVSDSLYGPHIRWGAQSEDDVSKMVWSAAQLAACTSENPTQMHQLTPPASSELSNPYGEWGGPLSIRRQALHAFKLELTHPQTGKVLTFQAKMPSDMRGVCDALSLDCADY